MFGRTVTPPAWATFIALAGYFFPITPSLGLDPSWQMALNHGWTNHWIFGSDVVFTYGPWGWLTTLFYDPETFPLRLAWELAWKTTTALLLAHAAVQPRTAL